MKTYKLSGRWLAVCGIAVVVIIIGVGGYFTTQHKVKGEESLKNQESLKKVELVKQKAIVTDIHKVENLGTENIGTVKDNEKSMYTTMHKMVNTKIVAVDGKIWGEIEITSEGCDKLITEINNGKQTDKVVLVSFLTHWKAGNFDDAVEEHNYLWGKLNGVQGRAISLR